MTSPTHDTAPSAGKAEFGGIYNQPDAAAYYATLGSYDYVIPKYGAGIAERVLATRNPRADTAGSVLDVCCSYGVGGALLTTDLGLGDLYDHYRKAEANEVTGVALAEADRGLFDAHRRSHPARVIGLDSAENAIRYAVRSGALDDGVAADLESGDPAPQLADTVGDIDLIMSTGGVGYVTARTFQRLLDDLGGDPWFAVFCLRAYDYSPIADLLAENGLQTEMAPDTFPQRRFIDAEEQAWAISEVRSWGLDPTGKESDGLYHAQLYVSRRPEVAERYPLGDLVDGLSAI